MESGKIHWSPTGKHGGETRPSCTGRKHPSVFGTKKRVDACSDFKSQIKPFARLSSMNSSVAFFCFLSM